MEDNWHEIVSWIKFNNRYSGFVSFEAFKDFGRGFYLSPDYAQAMERAQQITDLQQKGTPCVTEFDWDEEEARSLGLRIKVFEDYCREWAEFVFANRDRKHPYPIHDYDIVIGSIADDGVTYQLRRFREGDITMERLIEELKYAKGLTIRIISVRRELYLI